MKRLPMPAFFVMAMASCGMCFPQSSDQQAPPSAPGVSLGDYARKLKEQQNATPGTKPAKVYTSDGVLQTQRPDAYSLTEDLQLGLFGPTVVMLNRDGPKEAVDQIVPAGSGRNRELHTRMLYDFEVHKVYTRNLSDASVPCSVMEYTSLGAPAIFDPIGSAADSMKEFTSKDGEMKEVGKETINGIPTTVMETTSDRGKGKVWLAQNGGFAVKVVSIAPDGKEQTVSEVKQLSLAHPPASAFTPPVGCKIIRGEASASGLEVVASPAGAPGSTYTNTVTATALPGPAAFNLGASNSKLSNNVTAVTLQEIPNYAGPCPAHIRVVGTITTGGPGTVFYEFAGIGARLEDSEETIVFPAAGTKTVTHVMTFSEMLPGVATAVMIAVGVDSSGHRELPSKDTNPIGFTITCTSGGGK